MQRSIGFADLRWLNPMEAKRKSFFGSFFQKRTTLSFAFPGMMFFG